jgi:hypothetical protein
VFRAGRGAEKDAFTSRSPHPKFSPTPQCNHLIFNTCPQFLLCSQHSQRHSTWAIPAPCPHIAKQVVAKPPPTVYCYRQVRHSEPHRPSMLPTHTEQPIHFRPSRKPANIIPSCLLAVIHHLRPHKHYVGWGGRDTEKNNTASSPATRSLRHNGTNTAHGQVIPRQSRTDWGWIEQSGLCQTDASSDTGAC